jgi:spermidine synthase
MYSEDCDEEYVTYQWKNAKTKDKIITHRGTLVEMVERPDWGISCYMNGTIQSCERDEYLYHEALVHPAMASVSSPKRVMIIGGGEGATLREVLKWPVEQVDMYEWDKDVIKLFKQSYPQWAKGAWNDPRVTIHSNDIFDVITQYPETPYDVIIVDLFDPTEENRTLWRILFDHILCWKRNKGTIVYYSGMRSMNKHAHIMDRINSKTIIPYRVYIPSFMGESIFTLITEREPASFDLVDTHLTPEIWTSYKTFNW